MEDKYEKTLDFRENNLGCLEVSEFQMCASLSETSDAKKRLLRWRLLLSVSILLPVKWTFPHSHVSVGLLLKSFCYFVQCRNNKVTVSSRSAVSSASPDPLPSPSCSICLLLCWTRVPIFLCNWQLRSYVQLTVKNLGEPLDYEVTTKSVDNRFLFYKAWNFQHQHSG